jgi:HlyD family secretion protein
VTGPVTGENMQRAIAIVLAAFAGCSQEPPASWQGYVEGEFVLLASPYAGQLQKLHVRRGDRVESGKPVFVLEQQNERAGRLEAEERLNTAEARLENLAAARRKPEIEAQRAELAEAVAARELSARQLAQQEKLFKDGFVSQARLDEARAAHTRDIARVANAEAQLKTALQPVGRDAERKAAEGEVAAARAALAQAAWRQEQKRVDAPVSGLIQDTFFVEGEWVPAGRPVASLLPPGNVKVRFYVSEPMIQSFPVGRPVEIACSGCEPVAARINFVSSQAEFTPPVLYSKESRQKLMFLVEARPEASATRLHPGQPVDVTLTDGK